MITKLKYNFIVDDLLTLRI